MFVWCIFCSRQRELLQSASVLKQSRSDIAVGEWKALSCVTCCLHSLSFFLRKSNLDGFIHIIHDSCLGCSDTCLLLSSRRYDQTWLGGQWRHLSNRRDQSTSCQTWRFGLEDLEDWCFKIQLLNTVLGQINLVQVTMAASVSGCMFLEVCQCQ